MINNVAVVASSMDASSVVEGLKSFAGVNVIILHHVAVNVLLSVGKWWYASDGVLVPAE